MKLKNDYLGITKDLAQYHEYISSKRSININIYHLKESFKKNKKYFLTLIRFEKSCWRITCKDTIDSYIKWLDLFIDFIDGHDLSFQGKKTLNWTIWWLTKIHKLRKELEYNEWNCSWWEYGIFKKWEFWKKKILIIFPVLWSVAFATLLWIYDFKDIYPAWRNNEIQINYWTSSINSYSIIDSRKDIDKNN